MTHPIKGILPVPGAIAAANLALSYYSGTDSASSAQRRGTFAFAGAYSHFMPMFFTKPYDAAGLSDPGTPYINILLNQGICIYDHKTILVYCTIWLKDIKCRHSFNRWRFMEVAPSSTLTCRLHMRWLQDFYLFKRLCTGNCVLTRVIQPGTSYLLRSQIVLQSQRML